ncbi:cytochrome P450 306a1 [Periplaneta americana]|uniref:cytochrome P450 306a1 n=1 Tax=Periplaneta americana TaxID=6978 RepID=UPI0037E77992
MEEVLSALGTAFLLLIASVFFIFWIRQDCRQCVPPGPSGLPVVGFLPWINPVAPYLTLTQLAKNYGGIYSLQMGQVFTVVLSDHRLIRQALAKDALTGRAPLYLTHGIMQGHGIICAEGELWKDQRKFVLSCLKNFGMIKYGARREKMEKRILEGVKECLQTIESSCKSDTFDIQHTLMHSLGNVMNSLVFGVTYENDDPTWRYLLNLQEEGTKEIGVAGPINFLPFLRHLPGYKKTMKMLISGKDKTHQLYKLIIDKRIEKRSSPDGNDDNIPGNLIDAFLDERGRREEGDDGFYSDRQFHHLLADIFGAGLDTTLTTIRWFILFMAAYPEAQKKIQEEMDSLMNSRMPVLDDIPLLPYTQAAIAETQRIRSVVPVGIPHGALEDTTLGNYHIPKGTMIVPLQWAVHMSPLLWQDPETFKAERFLSEDGNFNKPEFFIPFQTGKRMCVGEEMAHMLLFLFGAAIIHKFRVSPKEEGVDLDLEGECGITLTPKPNRLKFTPRF